MMIQEETVEGPDDKSGAATELSDADTEKAIFGCKLRDLDLREPVIVSRDTNTGEVLAQMRETRHGGALISKDSSGQELVGVFTERDYLDKLAGQAELQKKPIESFMTVEPKVLSPDDTVGDAIRLMTEGGYRRLPLVEDGGRIFGMVTVRCIVHHFSDHFANEVYNHPPRINQWFTSREGA